MSNTNYANRGKSLEMLIEHANAQYKAKGAALIQKVATPWTVVWRGKKIVSAFPAEKSTVDFIGLALGCDYDYPHPVAFDAKQCNEKTRFPLSNIEQHQIDFLSDWVKQGGQSFLIIEMIELKKIYKVGIDEIIWYWRDSLNGGPKSIPIKDFAKFKVVDQAGGIVLDYLELMGR